MKILLIGPGPKRSRGGMATVIQSIKEDEELNQNTKIDVFESYADGNKLRVFLFSIFAFIKFFFTKRDYDLYHIHMASNGSTFRKGMYIKAVKSWKKPVILHMHGGEFMEFYRNSKRKVDIRNIVEAADMVIALSDVWKRRFDDAFDLRRCVVMKNGVNTKRFFEAILKPDEYPNSLVMLGRMGKNKGSFDLIRAIEGVKKRIPRIHCILAGDGEVEECKNLVKERGLEQNIKVLGWVDFPKKLDILKKTSIMVLPSYHEGLPMSILECMSCGKVIISTKVGAIPEVVHTENGILIEPGDIAGLEDAIVKCCSDTAFRNEAMKKNILKIGQEYSLNKIYRDLKGYYESLCIRNA